MTYQQKMKRKYTTVQNNLIISCNPCIYNSFLSFRHTFKQKNTLYKGTRCAILKVMWKKCGKNVECICVIFSSFIH